MNITKSEENGTVTIRVEGWLDSTGAPKLGEMIDAITEAKELVLDFDAVEYMSSAGIRQVLRAYHKTKALDAALRIIHVNPEVMNIFTMTGLDTKLPISAKN